MRADTSALERRNRELTILNRIADALNREVDLSQSLHSALALVADLFDLRTGWIWLLHEGTGEAYLAAAQHLPPALVAAPERMEGSCYCLDTYRAGDLSGAANINVITCSRLKPLVDGTDGLRYHASIPLNAHGKQLGVLNVASADWRELMPDDLRLLSTVGDLLSIAVERARLFHNRAQLGALEERNRLAREIHDTLAQGLTAIALQLETADALLEASANPDQAHRAVRQALQLTRANLEEARRSVLDLRAAPMEGRTLAEALAALIDLATHGTSLKTRYNTSGAEHALPQRVAIGLYRVAQEALANVARHARAHHLTVHLAVDAAQARLVVEDDGRGFDPAEVPAGHYGLVGIRERVRLMDGQLHLTSTPGMGTRLDAVVPLARRP